VSTKSAVKQHWYPYGDGEQIPDMQFAALAGQRDAYQVFGHDPAVAT
jgi:hypothetical protein